MDDVAPFSSSSVRRPSARYRSGRGIAERTGLRLFHNHIAIELALRYFETVVGGESRLAAKPSRRDPETSRCDLPELDVPYQLNSDGKFDKRQGYLRINNRLLTLGEVAARVIKHFDLQRSAETNPT